MASNLIIATLENRRAILSKLKAIIIVNLVLYTQQIINWRYKVLFTHFMTWKVQTFYPLFFSSVQFSRSVVSDSWQPHGLQHAGLPCPSLTPRACSDSCPSSKWCHPSISSSVVPFSSCLQSFPASGSFPVSQFFVSGGQILELQLQHQSLQWIFRIDFL